MNFLSRSRNLQKMKQINQVIHLNIFNSFFSRYKSALGMLRIQWEKNARVFGQMSQWKKEESGFGRTN